MQITISPDLENILYLAGFHLTNLKIQETSPELEQMLQEAVDQLRRRYASPAAAQTVFAPVRKMYRAVGLDPTRTRPSSEALTRRILQGKSLYRINSLVDCFNLLSVRLALPVGLYDLAHVTPPIACRRGAAKEGYPGIGKEHVNVAGRICMADAQGPFGNPSADSARTRIRPSTTEALAVYFVPLEIELEQIEKSMEETRRVIETVHPGVQLQQVTVNSAKAGSS